uniref:C-type lectin domain-containing protein n=1 Tax=Heligmosomoides polygyrus TaxID=6339 RepID=A0A183F7S7_HELPZ
LTWIGLHQANYPADTTWTWTDGTAVDYLNWAPTQPSNSDGKEHCVEIYSDHLGKDPAKDNSFQKWNDYQCTETLRAFVCKKAALH